MPRHGFKESKYTLQYAEIGYFKTEYPDYLYDFKLIYQDLMNYFEGFECVKMLQPKYDMLSKLHIKPVLSNRTYIVTNIDHVVLAMVNMDEAVIDNFIESFQSPFSLFEDSPDKVMTSYISTLYIFKGDEMCVKTSISPFRVAEFVSVFKNENLVNFSGARDSYYAKPRRQRKKSLAQDFLNKDT